MTREPIYAAIFELVTTGGAAFTTTSRKLLHWSDVPAEEQPALFQAQKSERAEITTQMPTKWHGGVDLYLYVNTKNATNPGGPLNPLLDAIEAMFARSPVSGHPTLGGLVQYIRIEGTIQTSEGTLGDQEVAIVPLRFLAV